MEIVIKPIEPHQIDEAKRMMLGVAERIYRWGKSINELVEYFDDGGQLDDLKDVQGHYFARRGMFLVALDGVRVVGTGALRPIDENLCELKRMWLLEEYHGKGIGYRIIQRLFAFAREAGYKWIRLETGSRQARAIRFYERVGFQRGQPVGVEDGDDKDVVMEMQL